jgi:lipopolysaccharide export system protein LptA
MMKLPLILVLLAGMAAPSPGETASPTPHPSVAKSKAPKQADKKEGASVPNLLGQTPGSNGPTTTEIYSDEAFFDSNKSMGIFTGHVKVTDPRFNLQSDKLTVFISKAQTGTNTQNGQASPSGQASPAGQSAQGEQAGQTGQTGQGQGLEKAIAEGNVAVVRDRPDPNGGPPTRAVGRSETATYTAATGDVELKGTPRVQQGENTHVATSPDTVMVINQSGQLTTHGPSRTEIRQEPKEDNDNAAEGGGAKKGDKSKGEHKGEGKPVTKASPTPKK